MQTAVRADSSPPPGVPKPAIAGAARAPILGWAVVFLGCLILYVATANRGVQWQDSGERILRVLVKDPVGSLGLALSHPLHHYLGRLSAWLLGRWIEPAFAVTLVSSLAGAVAVANVFGCVRMLTGRASAGLFAAASLAMAATFWQLATLTETYALGAALFTGECWTLLAFVQGWRGGLWLMLCLNGLGVSNHLLAGLTTPLLLVAALLAWRQRRVRWGDVAAAIGLWCVGVFPYVILIIRQLAATGDVGGTIRSALFGTMFESQVLNTHVSAGMLVRLLAFVAYNFPNLLLPAAVLGMTRGERVGLPRAGRWWLLAALAIHLLFVARYNVPDQHTFMIPSDLLLCIFGGVGAAAVMTWPQRQRRALSFLAAALLVTTPMIYAAVPAIARRTGVLEGFGMSAAAHRPYRDNYAYLLTPWSVTEQSADRMAGEAIRLAAPDGLIWYQDRMSSFALRYKQLRSGYREVRVDAPPSPKKDLPELQAALSRGEKRLPAKVVFVPTDVRYPPRLRLPGYVWVKRGELFMLEGERAATPSTSRAARPINP